MTKQTIHGGVTNGKFLADSPVEFTNAFRFFEGQAVTVTIDTRSDDRTEQQNKYLWGVIYPELRDGYRELGYDVNTEQVHGMVGEMFLKRPIFQNGEIVKHYIHSTAKLNKTEFSFFVEQLMRHGAEDLGIAISPPQKHIKNY